VANNLGVSAEKLAESMTVRYNKIRNEVFRVPLKPEEAADVRDAIAKALYGRQFNWLVERINRSISKSASTNARSFIGVLDIFGFENFTVRAHLITHVAGSALAQLLPDIARVTWWVVSRSTASSSCASTTPTRSCSSSSTSTSSSRSRRNTNAKSSYSIALCASDGVLATATA
jgi:hypothetical protein